MKIKSMLIALCTFGLVFAIDAPQNLEAMGGNQQIDLTWDGVDGASHYNVYQVVEDGGGTGGGNSTEECNAQGFDYADCDGMCFNDSDCEDGTISTWGPCLSGIGDTYCDDGTYGIDFNCEAWDFDGGDCDGQTGDDGGGDTGGGSAECEDCEFDWTAYGAECCDAAWEQYGIDCATLEGTYGWDCAGCACPGDVACEDQGLITCPDGSCAASEAECPQMLTDCSGVEFAEAYLAWIGDGYCDDGTDQGWTPILDFMCEEYDFDGGDCDGVASNNHYGQKRLAIGDQVNARKVPVNNNTREEYVLLGSVTETSASVTGFEDGDEGCFVVTADDGAEPEGCVYDWTPYGAPDCDAAWEQYGIDCATLEGTYGWDCAGCACPGDVACEDQGLITCPDGSCAASEAECPQMLTDCSGVEFAEAYLAWIGDGYCDDGTDQGWTPILDFMCEEYDFDGGDCDGDTGGGSAECEDCEFDWTAYGAECCDAAWEQYGIDCATLEGTYGWDCAGCACPGDVACEDQGLITCPDGSCAASEAECPQMLTDCSGVEFAEAYLAWIGDGYCDDGTDQGWTPILDFNCEEYDFDGGDCDGVASNNTNGKILSIENIALAQKAAVGSVMTPQISVVPEGATFFTNHVIDREESAYSNMACATASSCATAGTGDVNGDGAANVLDIVQIVNYILGSVEFDECQMATADLNGDGAANVLDIVQIVNLILGNRSADATSAKLFNDLGSVSIKADGYVGAVQMTLSHGSDFSLELTDNALVADYATNGNKTTLVVVVPENDHIFTANGEFVIEDMIVANSSSSINVVKATEFSLMSAYPNPFNPSTTLSLNVPADGFVSVKVFNIMGQNVATLTEGHLIADTHSFTWNASDVASGVYMVRAEYMGQVSTQKLMLLK